MASNDFHSKEVLRNFAINTMLQTFLCIVAMFIGLFVGNGLSDEVIRTMKPPSFHWESENRTSHSTVNDSFNEVDLNDSSSDDYIIPSHGRLLRPATMKLMSQMFNDQQYESQMPPSANSPTIVALSVYVISLNRVEEQTMDYSLSIYLRQKWTDPRLRFRGNCAGLCLRRPGAPQPRPGDEGRKVILHNRFVYQLWTPDIYFKNEKHSYIHKTTQPNRLVMIREDGEVFYSVKISLLLSCYMCLKKFPMDIQHCNLEMQSFSYTNDTVDFRWFDSVTPVQQTKKRDMPKFQITNTTASECSQTYIAGTYSCLRITFHLSRDLSFYMTQLYVPSILVVSLSWVGFWISYEAVPARVTLGLLTVLTMTNLRESVSKTLPHVGYLKAIDVWLAVCLVAVFASLLEFGYINYLSSFEHAKRRFKRTTKRKSALRATQDDGIVEIIPNDQMDYIDPAYSSGLRYRLVRDINKKQRKFLHNGMLETVDNDKIHRHSYHQIFDEDNFHNNEGTLD